MSEELQRWEDDGGTLAPAWKPPRLHCWHETGRQFTAAPPRPIEVCCQCGAERLAVMEYCRLRTHGPHAPPMLVMRGYHYPDGAGETSCPGPKAPPAPPVPVPEACPAPP